MSVLEILAEAVRHGVTMKLEGGKLALHAASEPPADLLARIRVNTSAIIRHLADKESAREGSRDSDLNPAELFADNVRKSLLCHSESVDIMPPSIVSHGQKHLLLDSDGRTTTAILVALHQERTFVLADWCESAAPGLVIPNLVRTARVTAGGPVAAHAKPDHFGRYDAIGLAAAARAAGQPLMKGGDVTEGREKLRGMMRTTLGAEPEFQISRKAEWTLRALSGGYAREADKSDATPGAYRLIGESLESFVASGAAFGQEDDGNLNYRMTPGGQKYLCSSVHVPRRARA